MSDSDITVELSFKTMLILHSAANEAVGYYDDERVQGQAPSEAESEVLSDSLDPVLDQTEKPYVWTFPRGLVPQARRLIPACLAVHDEEELQIRCMAGHADFEAAQVELLRLLEPFDV